MNIIKEIEGHLSNKNVKKDDKEELNKLYLQLLSNKALSLYNLGRYEQSMADCDIVLAIDQNHQKCLFRKAYCNIKLGENVKKDYPNLSEIEMEKKQIEYYEKARKDIEHLYRLDNKNKDVYDKNQELINLLVSLKLKHKRLEQDFKNKSESKPEKVDIKEEIKEQKKERSPLLPTGITKELLDKVTNNALKNVTDTLIKGEDLPKTSSQFETHCQSFKKNIDMLYFYLKVKNYLKE